MKNGKKENKSPSEMYRRLSAEGHSAGNNEATEDSDSKDG